MPSNKSAINKSISKLLAAFPAPEIDADKQKLRHRLYLESVSDLSHVALERAVSRFIKGEVERRNHTFAPTTAELCDETRRLMNKVAVDYAALEKAEREKYEQKRLALVEAKKSGLSQRAIDEKWAPALIGFLREHCRSPDMIEIDKLIRVARDNDRIAEEHKDLFAGKIGELRMRMHEAAAVDLNAV